MRKKRRKYATGITVLKMTPEDLLRMEVTRELIGEGLLPLSLHPIPKDEDKKGENKDTETTEQPDTSTSNTSNSFKWILIAIAVIILIIILYKNYGK